MLLLGPPAWYFIVPESKCDRTTDVPAYDFHWIFTTESPRHGENLKAAKSDHFCSPQIMQVNDAAQLMATIDDHQRSDFQFFHAG